MEYIYKLLSNSAFIAFASTIIGAIVGALGSYWANKKAFEFEIKINREKIESENNYRKSLSIKVISIFLKEEIMFNKTVIEREKEQRKELYYYKRLNELNEMGRENESSSSFLSSYQHSYFKEIKFSFEDYITEIFKEEV